MRIAAGIGTGLAVAMGTWAFEELCNWLTHQPALSAEDLARLAPWYLAAGLLIGVVGATVEALETRLLLCVGLLDGVLLGAKAATQLENRGLTGTNSIPAGIAVALLVVILTTRLTSQRPRLRWGMAVGAWWAVPTLLALNLNAFGSPLDPEALRADGAVALVGVALAIAAGLGPAKAKLRAEGLGILVALAAAPALVTAGGSDRHGPTPTPPQPARPDIVLVVIDTLRADHLGLHGYERPTTPGIDLWADSSMVYDDASSAAPWTLPSFASILTGTLPGVHGAGTNTGAVNSLAGLGATPPTLAERLDALGYRTGAIVTNAYLKRNFGLARGFETYDDALGVGHLPILLQPLDVLGLKVLQDRYYQRAEKMVAKARTWWASAAGGPRFLMLHLMDPHGPDDPDLEDRTAIGGGGAPMDLYDGEIHALDRALTPFLKDLSPAAVVVLTADHGEEWGDHAGAYSKEHWPADTRHGHTLYEELLHVPLVVHAPGIPAMHIQRTVRNLDITPTLIELAGGPHAEPGTGLDEVLGRLDASDTPAQAQAIRYGTEKRSVRLGHYKLIRTAWGDEVYDLSSDPAEQHDLAASRPEIAAALIPWLPEATTSADAAAPIDATTDHQLKALGYVE